MSQWLALFKKEMLGNYRDKKWIWVPLVFILITIVDPITNYYLPAILESVGGLPEEAVFMMPEISSTEAFMMSFGQLSTLGVLVVALISMGTISGERKSGVAELILVKPVSYASYVTSKWVALLLLVWVSYGIGMLVAWYYIGILYDWISFQQFVIILIFYGLWLTLVATLSIFYNTLTRSAGMVAFFTITTILALSLVTNLLGDRLSFSPSNLSTHLSPYLESGQLSDALYFTGGVTVILIAALLIASIYLLRTRQHAQ
jgi:ABC-2 type transport system permease protein